MMKGLDSKMSEEQLRSLSLFSSEQRRPHGSLQFSHGGSGEAALISALWWQQQDLRKGHEAVSGKGQVED